LSACHSTAQIGIPDVFVVEFLFGKLGGIERFDDFDPRKRFIQQTDHLSVELLRFGRLPFQLFYDQRNEESRDRDDQDREKGEFGRNGKKHEQVGQQLERFFENHLQRGRYRKLHDLHVGRYFGYDVSLALVIKVTRVQVHDIIEYRAPQVQQGMDLQVLHDALRKIPIHIAQEHGGDNGRTYDIQSAQRPVGIHGLLGIIGEVAYRIHPAFRFGYELGIAAAVEERGKQRREQSQIQRGEYNRQYHAEHVRDRELFDGFRK